MAFKDVPNEVHRGNRMNGSFPLTREPSRVDPPNRGMGGDRREGSFPLAERPSECHPPNEHLKFNVADAKMPQPPFPADKDAAKLVNPGPVYPPTLDGARQDAELPSWARGR
jgi:hypothetical protein